MHITIRTYQRSATDGAADRGMAMALRLKLSPHRLPGSVRSVPASQGYTDFANSSFAFVAQSEFVSEPHAKNPRPRDGLRRNELRARGEYALDHIRQVLGVELRRPGILRDAHGCVVLRERGIFKPKVRRAHVPTGGEWGIAAGLGERMRGMRGAGLREGMVRVHRPLVPQTQVELHRRRIGAGAAGRTVRILNAEDRLTEFAFRRRVLQQIWIVG